MNCTYCITFTSYEDLQAAVQKLGIVPNSVNCSPQPSKQVGVPTEEDLRTLLIKYKDSSGKTTAEIKEWMLETWGSGTLKEIAPQHWPDIYQQVSGRLEKDV